MFQIRWIQSMNVFRLFFHLVLQRKPSSYKCRNVRVFYPEMFVYLCNFNDTMCVCVCCRTKNMYESLVLGYLYLQYTYGVTMVVYRSVSFYCIFGREIKEKIRIF